MPLFLNISVPLLFNALYGEYVVRIPLSDRVFLPCGHGLDFGIISLCDNSIEQKMYFIRHTAEISCVCTNNKISCRQATYLYESSQLSCVSGHIYNLGLQIAQKSTYSLYFYYFAPKRCFYARIYMFGKNTNSVTRSMAYVCTVITYSRVWINRVRFPSCSWSPEQG